MNDNESLKQKGLVDNPGLKGRDMWDLNAGLDLEIIKDIQPRAILYRHGTYIKMVDLSDKVAKRLFIVETIELGAQKNRLASALQISRQTIHNYLETKKHFGIEGLIHSYATSVSKSKRKQREVHSEKMFQGNKAKQLAQMRRKDREEREERQCKFVFSFDAEGEGVAVKSEDQPYAQEHEWESTRYAGVFTYVIALISGWKWLHLVMGYFGISYKIFMVFLLMAARNIRSIEQLKNVRAREAGTVIGLGRVPGKPRVWEWFYKASQKCVSPLLLMDYFSYQIRAGLVGIWLWFTDGHLLPYTGKGKIHFSYHTQRRMAVPGQTNLVTCDGSGRVVDFAIEEGKGNLRGRIVSLYEKWSNDLPERPVMVFDREGYGAAFFSKLVKGGIAFVTWEKYMDSTKLSEIAAGKFTEELSYNGKRYNVFEGEKSFTSRPDVLDAPEHQFTLRRIYLWNRSSGRRACGLAWDGGKRMSTADCARAILSRWGASENTFKYLKDRHPLHYHPGFKLIKSDRQEIDNPAIKEKQGHINRIKKRLIKLYQKLEETGESLTKEGKPRKNSVRERIRKSIQEQKAELERFKQEKHQLPEKVDVTLLEAYKSFKKIENEGKYLFDFVTSSVWNARKQMVDWLCPHFNQENEVVDLFYAIADCQGWIKSTKKEVIVRLEPLQQPKRRMAQEQLCRKLTGLGARTPMGKWLTIEVGESPL